MNADADRLSSNNPDYLIVPNTPAPANYPFEPIPDEYTTYPFDVNYSARREAYLAYIRRNPAPTNTKAPWFEIARLSSGGTPHQGILDASLDYIRARNDCADFTLHAILRLFYQFKDNSALEPQFWERARQTVLDFKYWPNEPGNDAMCSWTENHYILFASAGYLAGQLFPDDIFSNSSVRGSELAAMHYPRILRWLNLRFFTGFSEWLSHVYYDEDLTALLNLVDFAQDEQIIQRAAMIIDLSLLDMALNNFAGVFGSTHGRSYEHSKKWAAQESTTDVQKLLFGRGVFSATDSMSAIAFALSQSYQMPRVLYQIANNQDRPEMLNRQRMGIRLSQLSWWELSPKDQEDLMHLLTLEAYLHPRTVKPFVKLLDRFGWWDNPFFSSIRQKRNLIKTLRLLGLLPLVCNLAEKDLCRNTREEVNLYTYRTPDYMLSTAQDYRKGYGGDQQHIWQATLGPNAVCFTTHPARDQGPSPNYWCGSGTLPRVAQIKNVVIAIYRIPKKPALYVQNELFYTHAWLPRDQFEEVIESEGWIFTRLGDGYLALLSQHPYEWRDLPGEDQGREIIVHKRKNIWLCELGRRLIDGEFPEFVERILQADVHFYNSRVTYHSPSQGKLQFGWKGPLRQDGRVVKLKDYPRYGNPYTQVDFPPEYVSVSLGDTK